MQEIKIKQLDLISNDVKNTKEISYNLIQLSAISQNIEDFKDKSDNYL
jgi:hypothetical protein